MNADGARQTQIVSCLDARGPRDLQRLWHLFREDDAGATLGINSASLDDSPRMPPAFHIWHQSHIARFDTADEFPRHKQGRQ